MIKALRDLVYILPMEDPEKRGSLYVPDSAKQKMDQGIVYKTGPKVKEIQVGDHVLFNGYDGQHLAIEGEPLLFVMKEEYLSVIVTDERTDPIFTLGTVKQLIAKGVGDLTAKRETGMTVDDVYMITYLQSLFETYFERQGLTF